MLTIKGLSKTYRGSDVKAVDNIDLEVKSGEIYGFLGPNGAGKTTTIRCVVGLVKPDAGAISVDGIDALGDSLEAKRHIGFAPDTPELYEKLTAREYLSFIADVFQVPRDERDSRADEILGMLNLRDSLDDLVQSFSHGMKQKLAVAAAVMHNPPLLVLDEPMTGLDPRSSHEFKEFMRRHCDRGGAVFFSTHILEVAERLCDHIGIISRGRIVATGTMDELRHKAEGESSLEAIFLELTQ